MISFYLLDDSSGIYLRNVPPELNKQRYLEILPTASTKAETKRWLSKSKCSQTIGEWIKIVQEILELEFQGMFLSNFRLQGFVKGMDIAL